MRVKTGETATARVTVNVQFRCSSCGKDNLTTQQVEGSAYSGTIMGFNLDRNLQEHAVENLQKNLAEIMDPDYSGRYRKAAFTCKCSYCNHAEPWAKMNYELLDKVRVFCLFPMLFFGVMSLAMLNGWETLGALPFIVWGITLLSAGAFFGIGIYKNKNTAKMEVLTARLPAESLPTVSLRTRERYKPSSFRKTDGDCSGEPGEVIYDKWVCEHCGTKNSMQYTQCKKCGKYK